MFISVLSVSLTFGQNAKRELPHGNYVVVGAYRPGDELYLNLFIKSLTDKGLNPQYGFETKRNFYYVYLEMYPDFKESINQMIKARKSAGFGNAWVRVIKDDINSTASTLAPIDTPSYLQADALDKNEATDNGLIGKIAVVPEEPVGRETIVSESPGNGITQPTEVSSKPAPSLQNAEILFNVYDAQKVKVINGDIEIVDTERARLITKVKGNDRLMLTDPKSKSGQISLICNVFGYRRMQREISYPNPILGEEAEISGDFYMVNFEMVRLQKGDISVLYNVYFYNDAAIMLPESKYELNQLLNMLVENPTIKIILHGHSNGNARGKIITMGSGKDYFSLTKDVKTSNGSARELSNQRAIIIRDWLLANGITADRVTVKPWGGKRMLHDKNGVNAKKNIRVEVEVMED
jgi:outer membrane protein OmpA-like peptidoglycan-associated protein